MLRLLAYNFANKDLRPEYFPILGISFETLFFVTCKNSLSGLATLK